MSERTTVIGRIGREPVRRSTPKGEVVGFSVAHTIREQGADGRWRDGETTWYEVSAWDRLGANVVGSLHKGQPVIVHGDVQPNEWTGRDGATRRTLDIRAAAIGHDLNLGTAAFTRDAPPAGAPAPPVAATAASVGERSGDWGALSASVPVGAAPSGSWARTDDADSDTPF